MAGVEAEGAEVTTATRGDAILLGGLVINVLHPSQLTGDSNEDSMVLLVDCGEVEVLLTGDAEVASERAMIQAGVLFDIDVLKVGHHGSRNSTSSGFLDLIQPEIGIISAGLDSQYGHPHREVVDRLMDRGVQLWMTDTSGEDDTVRLTSDCQTFTIATTDATIKPSAPGPAQVPVPATMPTVTPTEVPVVEPQAPRGCDPSYPTVCIPPPPPDLDCGEIPHRRFEVLAPDPHRFDGDKDGIGCEG